MRRRPDIQAWLLVLTVTLGACSLPDFFGFKPPPLARDFQSLCLKSRLDPGSFETLIGQIPGVKRTPGAPAPSSRDEVWTHIWTDRVDGKGLLISFTLLRDSKDRLGPHVICAIDDARDDQKTIAWLSRWTGTSVPPTMLAKYDLVVGPGRPKLIERGGSGARPTAGAGKEVYLLELTSWNRHASLTLFK